MKKFSFSKLFDNDRFLKVFSLLVAVLAWFLVTTMDGKSNTKWVIKDVPISTDLSDTTAGNNGLSIVSISEETVHVNVTGNYKVGGLNKDSVKVTMDVSRVTEPGPYTLDLVVSKADESNQDYEIEDSKPKRVKVEFERVESKAMALEAYTPNITASNDLFLDKSVVTPNELTVSGPKPIMDSIKLCRVETTEKAVLSKSQTFEGTLKFYDENGKEIDDSLLKYNQENKFTITVSVYKKMTVPLTFNYINVPEGIRSDEIPYTMSADTIDVGVPVDAATELKEISLGQIDFRKIDVGTTFPFAEVPLLAGYININSLKDVTVTFAPQESGYTSNKFTSENIVLKNPPANYNIEVLTSRLSDIKFVGRQDVIDALNVNDIVITVDCEAINISEGDRRVNVKISLAGGQQAWAVGEDYSMLIRVKDKN